MDKKSNILFVMLFGFVISYIFSAAFAYYGFNTTNLFTGFIIIGLTFSAFTLFERIFPKKTVGES